MRRRAPRRSDGGSIVVTAAILLPILFGMAALAVGIGYLYTRSRMLYAVADALVTAGMGDVGTAAAATDVNNLAAKYGGAYTVVPTSGANQLQVQVSATYPLFFGGIFGLSSRTLSVTAIGRGQPKEPALLSLGLCGSGNWGMLINGGGNLTINGDVESNGSLGFTTGLPGAQSVTGNVESPCAGSPSLGGSGTLTVGGSGSLGPFTDPFAADVATLPTCTFGDLVNPYSIPNANWGVGGVLTPGVYCSGGALTAASIDPCQCMVANGVTFIAVGNINLGNNGPSSITPFAGMPDSIVAYSMANTDCGGGEAINVGFVNFTVNGSIYAPNGCINAGDNSVFTVTGSLISKSINIGANGTWTIGTPSAGGGGNNWRMDQ